LAQTGIKLTELWTDYEEEMGEMAAYSVACNTLGIGEDFGYECLAACAAEGVPGFESL
jgi:hypothetical protein